MIATVSHQSSIVIQLSFNLSPKQKLSKLPKTDEIPLIPGLYLMIVNKYKGIIIPNDILSPEHPIVVAQAKTQPKN